MFVKDAVIIIDRLTIELRFVTKVDVDKTVVALETCCILAGFNNICGTACGKFMRIIAIPISKHVSHSTPGKDFNACTFCPII